MLPFVITESAEVHDLTQRTKKFLTGLRSTNAVPLNSAIQMRSYRRGPPRERDLTTTDHELSEQIKKKKTKSKGNKRKI